ncbi:hypothetical protein [Trueperella sp. LYQ143]|uniref:hypothetical protein n=1 Tax=unclassified Trueperella TaxID=2630174 RepID=UPI0039836D1F
MQRNGRITKRPYQLDGCPASTRDPGTWTSYEQVRHLPRKGWVLGEGIGCIDLDHCFVDGRLASWAGEVLDEVRACAVLVEYSPSGDGLHIFLPLTPGSGRVVRDGRNIEIYPPDSGRYICVTGRPYIAW